MAKFEIESLQVTRTITVSILEREFSIRFCKPSEDYAGELACYDLGTQVIHVLDGDYYADWKHSLAHEIGHVVHGKLYGFTALENELAADFSSIVSKTINEVITNVEKLFQEKQNLTFSEHLDSIGLPGSMVNALSRDLLQYFQKVNNFTSCRLLDEFRRLEDKLDTLQRYKDTLMNSVFYLRDMSALPVYFDTLNGVSEIKQKLSILFALMDESAKKEMESLITNAKAGLISSRNL